MERGELLKRIDNIKKEFATVSMKEIANSKNNFLKTKKYQCILKNSQILNREKIEKGGSDGSAIVIVALLENNEAIIIVQPRVFSKSQVGVEIPAGYIDYGETPLQAAKRELKEETGYVAKRWIHLKEFYQDQGISGALNHCYLALNCVHKYSQELDKDEYINYLTCSFDDLCFLVDDGIINDANGIIAIMEAKRFLGR